MGAEGPLSGEVVVSGRAVGTGPIERIDIFRGLTLVRTITPYTAGSFAGSNRYRVAWAGSRVRGRDRLTTWDGSLELSTGRVVGAVVFAMENPEKGIRLVGERRVQWISNTTGDDDGVDLTLDAPPEAVLRFLTLPSPPMGERDSLQRGLRLNPSPLWGEGRVRGTYHPTRSSRKYPKSCQRIPMAKRPKAATASLRTAGGGGPPWARSSSRVHQTVSPIARAAASRVTSKPAMTFRVKASL